MIGKSGFLVLTLIASGCLTRTGRDGEISASPPSSEGAPAPDRSDVHEPPSGVKGAPYVHVTPADIGVTIGPGVIAPYPTVEWTGGCNITTPGTTIENRIVNCSKIFKIDADNVTIRNSVVTALNGIKIGDQDASSGRVLNFLAEYNHINVPNAERKVFNVWGSYPGNDFRNFTIRNSHVEGGFDLFDMAGNLEGALFENNVLGPLACIARSEGGPDLHSDGFQIGGGQGSIGTFIIRGNWIFPGPNCGRTAAYFGAKGTMEAIIESNHLTPWGAATLWASDNDTMKVRYNVYSSDFRAQLGKSCLGDPRSKCGTPQHLPCCAYPIWAAKWQAGSVAGAEATCNRYEDGTFVEDKWFKGPGGVTHVTTGCPDYP